MLKQDYIDEDTRVTTHKIANREEMTVHFVTAVEKKSAFGWSTVEQKKCSEAESNHSDVVKEQEHIRDERQQEPWWKQQMEEVKQEEREERQQLLSDMADWLHDERQRESSKEQKPGREWLRQPERERERDRGYDRGR